MSFNSLLLAANTTAAAGGSNTILLIVYVAVIAVAMYFLLIRPQRKRAKDEKKHRDSIQIGDEIVTIGGIHGRIISLKEDTLVIESKSDHSKLTIARWALQQNLTPHEEPKAAPAVTEKKSAAKSEKKETK